MARSPPLPQVSASVSPVADATRAARLRSWIVIIGVLALAALAGSSYSLGASRVSTPFRIRRIALQL
jgi:hypothetical protein